MDAPPLPTRLQVEVTAACNLRCQMCLVAYRPPLAPRRASMTLERLQEILDELPDLEEVTLQGLGEPLLAPELFEMITEVKRRGMRVGFNTNGMLLTAERSSRLVDLEVDWLHVSIDGATPETLSTIRVGSRLEVIVENLRRTVAQRRAGGQSAPRIQVNTVLMRRNRPELPAIVALAASVGADRMWIQRLSHDFTDVRASGAYAGIATFTDEQQLDDDEAADALAAAADAGQRHGIDVRLPSASSIEPTGERPCDWPWEAMYVAHDGTVQPCCMVMGSERATLGSAAHQRIGEIWTGVRYRDFRRRLLSSSPPTVCRGCALYRGRF